MSTKQPNKTNSSSSTMKPASEAPRAPASFNRDSSYQALLKANARLDLLKAIADKNKANVLSLAKLAADQDIRMMRVERDNNIGYIQISPLIS